MFGINKIATSYKYSVGLVLVFFLTLLAGRYLMYPGYFDMHDDLQVMRQYQMHKCFNDGQIPCRWSADMGNGYGFPMFNYYSPLPNYFGIFFVWLGVSYMNTAKVLFLFALVGSGVGMYWFVWQLTKSLYASLTASALYIWAPYHAVDIFVRGAMAELWALMWMPFILGWIWLWFRSDKKISLFLILSITGLYLSHNIMSMWFTAVMLGWVIFLIIHTKYVIKNNVFIKPIYLFFNYLLAIGLGGFFLIPAIMEKKYIQSDTLTSDYYNFREHFVAWKQLLVDNSWGFGASRPGLDDEISFQVGYIHWVLVLLGTLLLIYFLARYRISYLNKIKGVVSLIVFWLFCTVMAMFMTHARSVWIWELFPFLAWTQFPWRVLGIVIFAISITGGLLISLITNKNWSRKISVATILGVIMLNWNYFVPKGYDKNLADVDKLTGVSWKVQQKGALLDYLPKSVQTYEVEYPDTAVFLYEINDDATAEWRNWRIRSNEFSFDIEMNNDENIKARVSVFDFPGWRVYLDGNPVKVDNENLFGQISFDVKGSGKHFVLGRLESTPARYWGNLITVISYLILVGLAFYPINNKKV